ncbi:DoxX family protein [Streptomyces sp. AN091965]|uniref:DoxX family protein n=1 Tax=Streptomyces sp. AN091965 TaxID=2927803 RepID=UPI001F61ECD6|nr:DoxX family protein [Streptomyces sp. AN091965]MCI3927893.1 DoxX family protein [Streptomyces sp. AN091965]
MATAPPTQYGVPQSWRALLSLAKAGGAIGLLVGFAVPAIGAAAAIGLFLHFGGAVITVLRTRSHKTITFPVLHLAPVVAAIALGYAA